MSEQIFEAESVEAALQKASAALGVETGELDHEVVEKKQDFWGAGDSYVIKAWQRAAAEPAAAEPSGADEPPDAETEAAPPASASREREEPPAAAAEALPAETDAGTEGAGADADADATEADAGADVADADRTDSGRSGVASSEPEAAGAETPREPKGAPSEGTTAFDPTAEGEVDPEEIGALLAQIFHDMEFDCTVEVEGDDEGFSATVSGADKEELLEGNGRCLSALELLVNNAFRNRMSRGDKIRVDAGNFRSRRDQELTDLAYQVAHSAKESGETQETQELNPYERRLVHLALAEDQAVTTKSRGGGFLKNVQVIPQKQGRGGRGPRR